MVQLRAYVDESKARGYIMVAVICDNEKSPGIRRTLQELRLPGQRRIHMRKESPKRQREILSKVSKLQIRFVVSARHE
ncbi:MAG: hypothetical protein RJA35_323 [Actinomycetota bacterium]|jgi:hypothetical protein